MCCWRLWVSAEELDPLLKLYYYNGMIPKPFAPPRIPHAPTPWRNLRGKGVVIYHLRFLKELSERRRGISPSCPPDVFQPVPLYLVRPPPSWLSILVALLFAVRLFFWAGGLSLIVSFQCPHQLPTVRGANCSGPMQQKRPKVATTTCLSKSDWALARTS